MNAAGLIYVRVVDAESGAVVAEAHAPLPHDALDAATIDARKAACLYAVRRRRAAIVQIMDTTGTLWTAGEWQTMEQITPRAAR